MNDARWMLYGAYGYTGELIAEEAVRRGHRPTLAGRSREKTRAVADRLGLPFIDVSLDDAAGLAHAVEGHRLVLHAAGPFIHTALPMLRACLDVGAHYLDITGEIPVFEQSFAHDREAREKGVAVISGVGFDVVPTDCLARYVAEKITDPRELEIAISALGGAMSAGTLKSSVEAAPKGGWVRREGILIPWTFGKGITQLRFPHGTKTAVPIPWGDLSTAFHSTGVPNITTYMTYPRRMANALRVIGPALPYLLKPEQVRSRVLKLIGARVEGPSEEQRRTGRSYCWARAKNARGDVAEAWLESMEGYRFTAVAGVRAVEKTLASELKGALTPSRAFGTDFVLELPETRRMDSLG